MWTNVRIADSTATTDDYAKRAIEVGSGILSTCEHGWQGNIWKAHKAASENNLKLLVSAEAYWVKDRTINDNSNCHIFIGAKNENGRQALNDVLSEANLTGYYYQPRIDIPLIMSLPKDDVIVTTACVAYWKYDDIESITEELSNHFGKNFFLEVQYHDTPSQRLLNKRIIELHNKLKIPIIMGCDSHYIHMNDALKRTDFLVSKGIEYPEEEGWFLDYPTEDIAYDRFAKQCILSSSEINDAISNTNVFLDVEEYDTTIFNSDIKMPTLYPEKTQEERNQIYKNLIWFKWDQEKENIPEENWDFYKSEIQKEIDTVVTTNMSDYFIDNYHIIKKGKELGGKLTKTGRGCFDGEVKVLTPLGYKKIKDVKTGDMVFDGDGNIQKVTNTMIYHVDEPMVKINYSYQSNTYSPVICTEDHKILANRKGKLEWIEARHLLEGDYLCIPKLKFNDNSKDVIDLNDYNIFGFEYDDEYIYEYYPSRGQAYKFSPSDCAKKIGCSKSAIENIVKGDTIANPKRPQIRNELLKYTGFESLEEYIEYVKKSRTKKIKRYLKNDYLTNVWFGLMYGDGCVRGDRASIGLAISTSPNSHKNIKNRKIFSSIMQRLELEYSEEANQKKQLSQLIASSKILTEFLSIELFVSKKDKLKKFNNCLFYQPYKNRMGLKLGLLFSDGSSKEPKRISFDNISTSIIDAYRIIEMSTQNSPTWIGVRKSHRDNRGYQSSESYKLRTYPESEHAFKKNNRAIVDDNYTYVKFLGIEKIKKQERDVYDITVENSHSYVVDDIVVHNSAPSFYTNKLLGFTDVDRIAAKVKMYPERFMSATRILESGSLPDIDFNSANVEPFAKAQKEILGEDHSYPMIAYGTAKKSAAWKLYAKSQNIPFEIANEVSNQLKKYELAVKHAEEDEADEIDVMDFIGEEFKEVYSRSKEYWGLITSWSIAPCSYLLYQGSIRKEIGLVRIKDHICCLMDGEWAEKCHFLKNDQLKVSVWDLIYRAYEKAGLEPPSVSELLKECSPDNKAWDMYEKGCTLSINQVEQKGTSARVTQYKPKNISELCAFVAAIRPG